MKYIRRCLFICLCAVLFWMVGTEAYTADAQTKQRTVRVVFPSQGGMSEIGEGGDLIGYNYSYLQELAEYAGWKIEYITFENQEPDEQIMSAMETVMSGEADLIGPMLKSDDVEAMFEFPSGSYGTVYTTLCSLEKSNITSTTLIQDTPLRIAVYKKAEVRNKEVQDYLNQLGQEYELIECDSTEEQLKLLEEGRADVLSSITLSFFAGTRAVAEFAPRPYYLVSTKGNTEVISELENAIEAMNYTRPHFQEQLQEQFFGDTSGGYILSEEEKESIDKIKEFNIICADNYAPYGSRADDGTPQGLLVSILEDFADDNQIKLNYTFCKDGEELDKLWSEGIYDGIIGFPLSAEYCARNSILQTAPVISASIDIFRKPQTTRAYGESTVAVYNTLADAINLSQFKEILRCNSLEECFNAVKSGKAEYGCVNQLSMDYVSSEYGIHFVSTLLLGETLDICFAVKNQKDYRILAAMNKYIYTRPDSGKTAYLSKASQHEGARTLAALIRTNPIQTVLIITIVAVLFFSAIILGINARRNQIRNQQLLQANAAKSEFLSRMSHDIRTPLNAILGFAKLGKEDLDSRTDLENDLDRISSSGEFLLGLVNDVLDMTKIESSAMKLQPEKYARTDFIKQIRTLVAPQCAAKNITFIEKMDENLPEYLYVDKLRFNQIFFNILSNAVKFTQENGKIEISGRTIDMQNDNCRMQFVIQDNGVGMSEEFQKIMFDSFSQEHSHISESEGTGLGLAIVKSLVDLMQGTIQVSSRLGEGSTFTIELPAEQCTAAEEKAEGKSDSQKDAIAGKKLLLCEDQPINTQLACRILENAGAKVVCAKNGREGVDFFAASEPEEYAAILMDIRMPVMDGIEATKTIRAMERKDAKKIPIIAMTANAFLEDMNKTKEAGMDAHLSKPIDIVVLYETLGSFMKTEK